METDGQGQLGGLETTEAVRRCLAKDSASFKCSACLKTNAEIISQCEISSEQASGFSHDFQIPKGLSMTPVGELANIKDSEAAIDHLNMDTAASVSMEDSSHMDLAEGFFKASSNPDITTSTLSSQRSIQLGDRVHLDEYDNSSSVSARTPTLNLNRDAIHPGTATTSLRQRSDNEIIPVWIDRAIIALGFLLAAMLVKVACGM